MGGKISPVLTVPWARRGFGALQGSALLQGCVVMQELNIHSDLVLPIPITGAHFHAGTPACPDICSCTDHRERSGTKRASKTNQISWWQQPMRKCPLPSDTLSVQRKEEGAALWADCCPSQALLPPHSKAIEELGGSPFCTAFYSDY